eukprot:7673121-Pyramimonas_sp.AAC.1
MGSWWWTGQVVRQPRTPPLGGAAAGDALFFKWRVAIAVEVIVLSLPAPMFLARMRRVGIVEWERPFATPNRQELWGSLRKTGETTRQSISELRHARISQANLAGPLAGHHLEAHNAMPRCLKRSWLDNLARFNAPVATPELHFD